MMPRFIIMDYVENYEDTACGDDVTYRITHTQIEESLKW